VKIVFKTPVRFSVPSLRRRCPKFSLFPEPERVFPNILRHWNRFFEPRFSVDGVVEFVRDFVFVSDYRLRPVVVEMTHGRKVVGSVGYVMYRFLDRSNLDVLLALLRYGELFNVGTGRSMGLGVNLVKIVD
ncbi:MAG: hypothetical protein DRN81_07055, partial [Thermoproteota archaeon]